MPMTIHSIANWFAEAIPAPTDKNRAVQLGCHFEEVAEMADAISEEVAVDANNFIAEHLKRLDGIGGVNDPKINREALLDALCDQIVTAIGVAHMFGLNIQGALAEVNRSNYSKFVDGKPVFDANGKIAKPPSYSKPDLTPFVGGAQ
jgi:predicted HAD superfamily Cof-like phosphohydrolase